MPLGRGRNKNRKEVMLCTKNVESVYFTLLKTETGFVPAKIQNTAVSILTITILVKSFKKDERRV